MTFSAWASSERTQRTYSSRIGQWAVQSSTGLEQCHWRYLPKMSPRSVVLFQIALFPMELRTKILETLTPTTNKSMSDIRKLIEDAIKTDATVRKINGKPATGMGGKLNPEERLAIRKMMSRYWDNHTPFAMDLSGAVIRQGTFINKMHGLDWLHSPASAATMARLLAKYDRFFRIMATNPGRSCRAYTGCGSGLAYTSA